MYRSFFNGSDLISLSLSYEKLEIKYKSFKKLKYICCSFLTAPKPKPKSYIHALTQLNPGM
jgi:hypothetical protein